MGPISGLGSQKHLNTMSVFNHPLTELRCGHFGNPTENSDIANSKSQDCRTHHYFPERPGEQLGSTTLNLKKNKTAATSIILYHVSITARTVGYYTKKYNRSKAAEVVRGLAGV